jgi:hypothetical protein
LALHNVTLLVAPESLIAVQDAVVLIQNGNTSPPRTLDNIVFGQVRSVAGNGRRLWLC